jgi:coenzyme F420-reducing hydrogenase delta subunit
LNEIGLGARRLEMFHIGASDAPLFAEAVEIMTERAKEAGPNPFRLLSLRGVKRSLR